MIQMIRAALSMILVMTLITGLAYPLAITGIAQLLFPDTANGSLVRDGDAVLGSRLIGQDFTRPDYFHPRPSAAKAAGAAADDPRGGYDPLNSGGSNLAPSSSGLVANVTAAIQANQPDNPDRPVPGDLATSSASGLDPDITPEAADFQVPRVAKARGLSEDAVRAIVKRYTKGRTLGLLGEPRVNVLMLNLALDGKAGQ